MVSMNTKSSLDQWASVVGLFLIGGYCFMSAVFQRHFAQVHVNVPGVSFPIFVGEIVMFVSMLCAAVRMRSSVTKWRPAFTVTCIYLVWMAFKVFSGYQVGGAFALRNAALFYYPLFVWITYYLYDRELIKKSAVIVLLITIGAKLIMHYNNYFIFPYYMLSIILVSTLSWKWVRIGLLFLVFYIPQYHFLLPEYVFFPFIFFFHGSRARVLGHLCALIFLGVFFCARTEVVSKKIKLILLLLSCVLMFLGVFYFADQNALRSVSNIKKIQQLYSEYDEQIKRKSINFSFSAIEPEIYSPEEDGLKSKIENVEKVVFKREEVDNIQREFIVRAEKIKSDRVMEMEHKLKGLEDSLRVSLDPDREALEARVKLKMVEVKNFTDLRIRNEINDLAIKLGIDRHFTTDEAVALGDSQKIYRDLNSAYNNIFFRLFIWRDMLVDLNSGHWLTGMSFGHPQRSKSLEVLTWASGEWSRDGWVATHNSFWHIIYRAGILGVVFVLSMFVIFGRAVKLAFEKRSVIMALCLGVFVYWIIVTSFSVFLEVPYLAIPCWSLAGLLWAYTDERVIPADTSSMKGQV